MSKNIIVTGGLGYIGSHSCVELIEHGYTPIIIDNLCNSKKEALGRLYKITGQDVVFYEEDIRNREALDSIFEKHNPLSVIHFAGLKAVGESVEQPARYYSNNVKGSLYLIDVMKAHDVKSLIFSSSATVYNTDLSPPFTEDMPTGQVSNPYGRTKYMVEEMMKDITTSDASLSMTILRYFNPVGAHESGLIGEDPQGIPNNLMPYMAKVASGELAELSIYGDDYDTADGTGVRDYIHVVDLARGHVMALNQSLKSTGLSIYNLGSGEGCSVKQVLSAYESACGNAIPYKIVGRRAGDIAASYADIKKAQDEMGWALTKNLDDMCQDSWRWIKSGGKAS